MRYNIVDNSKRKQLIDLVYGKDPITIREACARLGIKLTTAKTILKIYRREGRVSKLTFRSSKPQESAEFQKDELSPDLESKESNISQEKRSHPTLQACKVPEEKEFSPFSSYFQTRLEQLPREPEESLKIKLPAVPASIDQYSPRELSDYLSGEVQQFTERGKISLTVVKQLDYISNSYRLLDKLYQVLKDSESKIMAYQSQFRNHILPAVMNEFLKRQGPLFQQFLSLPSSVGREITEDEMTPSLFHGNEQDRPRDVRK